MAERIDRCAAVRKAAPIARDVLWAHREGRFTLSVPAALALIEGSLRRHGFSCGLLVSETQVLGKNGRVREADVATVVKLVFPPCSLPVVFFVRFLTERLFNQRNPILHGNDVTYPTEVWSAQCILALNEVMDACRDEP